MKLYLDNSLKVGLTIEIENAKICLDMAWVMENILNVCTGLYGKYVYGMVSYVINVVCFVAYILLM